MKKTIVTLACALITPLAFAQTNSKGTRQATTTAAPVTGTLQGIVKDPKGHPIKSADIRIETKNKGTLLKTVKTDANGRYISDGLPARTYRVTLVVNGTVKASINSTKIELGEPTQLNFDLKSNSTSQASAPSKKGTHWVWVPAFTGSRLPGRWVEVNDSGTWAGNASTLNVVRVSGEELQRTIHSVGIKRGQ
jgi:hypothetical protein